jgi:cephalosporin hydroxylase
MRDLTASPFSPHFESNLTARAPDQRSRGMTGWLASKYNRLHESIRQPALVSTSWRELCEVRQLALAPTDINEHLERIFIETVLFRPTLIVELGVRGGASTYVFERAARLADATLVSVDISDCSRVSSYPKWHFIQGDDIAIAYDFPDLCATWNIKCGIDVLFVDTSHYFDHTVEEIRAWFPLLSPRAKVIFHDTNLRAIGPRRDGRFQLSWDNNRGVIRALEQYCGICVDEQQVFTEYAKGFVIRHWPICNGLTILDRLLAS